MLYEREREREKIQKEREMHKQGLTVGNETWENALAKCTASSAARVQKGHSWILLKRILHLYKVPRGGLAEWCTRNIAEWAGLFKVAAPPSRPSSAHEQRAAFRINYGDYAVADNPTLQGESDDEPGSDDSDNEFAHFDQELLKRLTNQ